MFQSTTKGVLHFEDLSSRNHSIFRLDTHVP